MNIILYIVMMIVMMIGILCYFICCFLYREGIYSSNPLLSGVDTGWTQWGLLASLFLSITAALLSLYMNKNVLLLFILTIISGIIFIITFIVFVKRFISFIKTPNEEKNRYVWNPLLEKIFIDSRNDADNDFK